VTIQTEHAAAASGQLMSDTTAHRAQADDNGVEASYAKTSRMT